MNLYYIGTAIFSLINLAGALAAHYKHDYHAVTIIGNCLMPVLAIFFVCLLNEMQRLYQCIARSGEDDE